LDERAIVGGEFFVAVGETTTLLDLVEEQLNQIGTRWSAAAKADCSAEFGDYFEDLP
jgi:hypothetical protein